MPARSSVPITRGRSRNSLGLVVMQEACGLEEDARHPSGAALYLEQARQLWGLVRFFRRKAYQMVLAWEPAWGMVTSHDFEDRLSGEAPPGTSVGWVTYISRQRGEVPVLPEPVRVEPVEDKGSLIIPTPERLSV